MEKEKKLYNLQYLNIAITSVLKPLLKKTNFTVNTFLAQKKGKIDKLFSYFSKNKGLTTLILTLSFSLCYLAFLIYILAFNKVQFYNNWLSLFMIYLIIIACFIGILKIAALLFIRNLIKKSVSTHVKSQEKERFIENDKLVIVGGAKAEHINLNSIYMLVETKVGSIIYLQNEVDIIDSRAYCLLDSCSNYDLIIQSIKDRLNNDRIFYYEFN